MSIQLKLGVGSTADIQEVYRSRAKVLTGDSLRPTLQAMGAAIVGQYNRNIELGRFPDLAAKYKKDKQRVWGHVYPILVASGQLVASFKARVIHETATRWVTQISAPGTHVDERGRELTNNKLAEWHRDGTATMPARDYSRLDDSFMDAWHERIRQAIRTNSRG